MEIHLQPQDIPIHDRLMKSHLLALSLGLLITSMNSMGQAVPPASEFASTSPERAIRILNAAEGTEQRHTYVKAAMRSKRIALIKACFENPYSWILTRDEIAALPQSEIKDSLTLMMLASESHFWPLEGDELDGSFPEMKPIMDEPFASLVKRLLPDHTLSDDAISTKEKRMNLATDLEFALGQASSSNKQPATLPDLRTEQPAANAPPSSNVVSKQPTMPASSKPKAREAKLIPARDEQPAATPWLVWTVMIVAAIGLLWLVLRNRK